MRLKDLGDRMKIQTQRLELREYKECDIANIFKLKSCDHVWKYSTYTTISTYTEAELELKSLIDINRENPYTFKALYLKDTDTYIGEAGIISYTKSANRCVIGYNLLPEYWNQGYATEISKAIIQYAFAVLKVERVEALVQEENTASRRVIEKTGLLLEGILKHFAYIRGNYVNVCYYGIIAEEYNIR